MRLKKPAMAAVTVWVLAAPTMASASTTDTAAPPTSCVVVRLTEPAGSRLSIVTGADPAGRYIVGRGYPKEETGRREVVIWQDHAAPVPVDLPGIDQQLADINSSGVAVGFSYDPDTFEPMTPWIYRQGRLAALPGVESGEAVGVNESGQVAGNRYGSDGGPLWWPDTGSAPVGLPLPSGAINGAAYDIDYDGTIVGYYTDQDGITHGYHWRPDGYAKELPLPDGLGPTSRAFSIRNGWVTGLVSGNENFVAMRWHLPGGKVRTYPEFDITANAVNQHGWLVGSSLKGKGLFVSDANILELPGLADHNEPLGDIATTVSDNARVIAGQALDRTGSLRAVRWRCR